MQLFEVSAPKRELIEAIVKHCNACLTRQKKRWCSKTSCEFYRFRIGRTVVPDQYHLFRVAVFEDFVHAVMNIVPDCPTDEHGSFWWSDVRQHCERMGISPMKSAWWGRLTNARVWRQQFRQTENRRPSPLPRTNGRVEFQWQRRASQPLMAAM